MSLEKDSPWNLTLKILMKRLNLVEVKEDRGVVIQKVMKRYEIVTFKQSKYMNS